MARTSCPLDCPDGCSLEVTVSQGRITAVTGTHANPLTQGLICGKVRQIADHVYCAERVSEPLVRNGPKGRGSFRSVSWDTALDLIAERTLDARDRLGGASIVPCNYGGSNGALTDGSVDERFFRRLGASRLARDLCAAPTGRAAEGLYGRMVGVPLEDYIHAQTIVIWGTNPAASGIHLVPIVRDAQARGARVIVIDPRRVGLATSADLHLAPKPGTDLPLALALIRWMFENGRADAAFLAEHTVGSELLRERAAPWTLERAAAECDVPRADIETLARWYCDRSPSVVRCGWGIERNRNGGSAAAAILALPAVAGKFGVRGGGYTMSQSKASRPPLEDVIATPIPPTRTVSLSRMGSALLDLQDPPIAALFVYNANILQSAAHQERVRAGLLREDLFTVVFDAVMTDTAQYADVILPATTFLEHHDLRASYGSLALVDVQPVIAPVGQARPNHDVFGELIRRCHLEQPGDIVEPHALRAALLRHREGALEILKRDGLLQPVLSQPILFRNVHPATPDGKVHFVPSELDSESGGLYVYKPDPGSEPFPLALISPATARRITTTFGQLDRRITPVEVHPDELSRRGLKDGQPVRIFNPQGEVHCPVLANPQLRRGMASLPKGLWSHNTLNGRTSNALVPEHPADLGGGGAYNDARVQIEALDAR